MLVSAFNRPWLLSILLMASVVACEKADDPRRETAGNIDPVPDRPSGTVAGRVILEGGAPRLEPLAVAVNQDVCGAATRNNRVEVGPDGGLGGAVVYLAPVDGSDPAPSPAQTMDQVRCVYSPRVIAAPPGSPIRFTNSDPTRHNVRIEDPATGRMLLNVSQEQGKLDEWKVPGVGAFTVLCDYHPWMNAYIVGVPGPHYAVTSADGSFSIEHVPEGEHRVHVWLNGIEMTPKLDNRGQLVGYRFDDAIERDSSVKVTANATVRLELPVKLR